MNVNEIKELVELLNDSSISELKIENKDFKISIRTKHFYQGKVQQVVSQAMPMPQALPSANLMPAVPTITDATNSEQIVKEGIRFPVLARLIRNSDRQYRTVFKATRPTLFA